MLGYVLLFVIGLIVLVSGLSSLPNGWASALLGIGLSAVGAFEVRITYNRIQGENKSIKATQSGSRNIQTNQTNPNNSPVINKADTVIFSSPQTVSQEEFHRKREKTSNRQLRPEVESISDGHIHFEDFQDFRAELNKGDTIKIHVESEDPVSVQIMSEDDFDSFDPDVEGNDNYWESPRTTNYDYSWTSKYDENVVIVIIDEMEQDPDYEDDEETEATLRIDVIRKIPRG